jgi:hypothetical protein
VSSTSVVALPRCAETTVTGQRWCSKTGAEITLMSWHIAPPVLLSQMLGCLRSQILGLI